VQARVLQHEPPARSPIHDYQSRKHAILLLDVTTTMTMIEATRECVERLELWW
jgi:hypothetical protein